MALVVVGLLLGVQNLLLLILLRRMALLLSLLRLLNHLGLLHVHLL